MASAASVTSPIAKPPRRFSANVAEHDSTVKQQVARAVSSPSSINGTRQAAENSPILAQQSDDAVDVAATESLGVRQPSSINFSQKTAVINVISAPASPKARAVADDDELELWKLSHRDVLQRLMDLTDRYSDLEAKHKELDEKYHRLVRYVNSKQDISDSVAENDEIVSSISDKAVYAFGSHDRNDSAPVSTTTVDEYGFLVRHAAPLTDELPVSIRDDLVCDRRNNSVFYSAKTDSVNWVVEHDVSSAEKRQISYNLSDQMGISVGAHRIKFEKLLASRQSMPSEQFRNQLKHLMRYGAPTPELRTKAWQYCVSYHLYRRRCNEYVLSNSKQYYQSLLDHRSRTLTSASSSLATSDTLQLGAAKQIGLDLLRTFPNNIHFKDNASPLVKRLENVLTAFSKHNIQIGYTQGMNRLAGIALLCLPEEADAFWALVTIVEHLLPGYYGDTMRELLIDQRVFAELVAEKMPRLALHLKTHYIDINLFSFNWFLVVFVDSTLPYVFMALWDAFMLEGKKVLFRYALAMLKYWERDLMTLDSCSALNNFLRTMGERIDTPEAAARLRRIAFGEMNPLPSRVIERKRRAHRAAVELELASIQRARDEIKSAYAVAAVAEAGVETLNLLTQQRTEREQQPSRNTTDDYADNDAVNFDEPNRTGVLSTDLDSVSTLYFADAVDAVSSGDINEDDEDNDSWHSVQSSYNYDKFDDSGGSPYGRSGGEAEIRAQSELRNGAVDANRFCESAPDLSSTEKVADGKTTQKRGRSASCCITDSVVNSKSVLSERPKSTDDNFFVPNATDVRGKPDAKVEATQTVDCEYFSVRCPSQLSTSRSDSTTCGPTPIPPPRKVHQRQQSASPTDGRFGRLLSRATALRSSFGGSAATKKAMLNRAISNVASRHGVYLKRKMTSKQQVAAVSSALEDGGEVSCIDKKCEHHDKPQVFSHDVKESGLSTFYFKLLRKCHCAMDFDDHRKNLADVNEITPTSAAHFDFPALRSTIMASEEVGANSIFFHSKYYAVGENNVDDVTHASSSNDEDRPADAVVTRRRTSLAVTLRSAVTHRIGQLITTTEITKSGPPYDISAPVEDNTDWRNKAFNTEVINASASPYLSTPEMTVASLAVQESTESSVFFADGPKQSASGSRHKNRSEKSGQKFSDSSRFILKLPQPETFGYGEILPSIKPVDF